MSKSTDCDHHRQEEPGGFLVLGTVTSLNVSEAIPVTGEIIQQY